MTSALAQPLVGLISSVALLGEPSGHQVLPTTNSNLEILSLKVYWPWYHGLCYTLDSFLWCPASNLIQFHITLLCTYRKKESFNHIDCGNPLKMENMLHVDVKTHHSIRFLISVFSDYKIMLHKPTIG